jgi:bacterioferritin-associated ferredoxin
VYVCICMAITTQTILDLAADGVSRTSEVGERCGAGTVCAKCRPTIRRLLTSAVATVETHRPQAGPATVRPDDS